MSELPNLDTIDDLGRNDPDPFAPFIGKTLEELDAMDEAASEPVAPHDTQTEAGDT